MCIFFFFNDTATTEIYTLSLHDALPILVGDHDAVGGNDEPGPVPLDYLLGAARHEELVEGRSEEHTSELQSLAYLVCRLLLEKKKKITELSNHVDRRNCEIMGVPTRNGI